MCTYFTRRTGASERHVRRAQLYKTLQSRGTQMSAHKKQIICCPGAKLVPACDGNDTCYNQYISRTHGSESKNQVKGSNPTTRLASTESYDGPLKRSYSFK